MAGIVSSELPGCRALLVEFVEALGAHVSSRMPVFDDSDTRSWVVVVVVVADRENLIVWCSDDF